MDFFICTGEFNLHYCLVFPEWIKVNLKVMAVICKAVTRFPDWPFFRIGFHQTVEIFILRKALLNFHSLQIGYFALHRFKIDIAAIFPALPYPVHSPAPNKELIDTIM